MLAENKKKVSAGRINENDTEHTGLLFPLHPEDSDSYCLFEILLCTNYI